MKQCHTKERVNSRARPTRLQAERRAPALRITGTSLSRGAGALRSERHRPARGRAFPLLSFSELPAQILSEQQGRSEPTHVGCYFFNGLFSRACLDDVFQPELLRADFPHPELLDLAGHRGRELSHKFDVARDLVVHDLSVAEGLHFRGAHGRAFLGFHPGYHLLAVVGVRDADDVSLGNLRVGEQKLLDLPWENLLAAT